MSFVNECGGVRDGDLADAICRRAFELGLVIETRGPHGEVVKVLAPLTTDEAMLQRGLSVPFDAAQVVVAKH